MANLKMVGVMALAVLTGACSSNNSMVASHTSDAFRAPAQATGIMRTVFGVTEREVGAQVTRSFEQQLAAKISANPAYYGATGAVRSAEDIANLSPAAQERILREVMQAPASFGINLATYKTKIFNAIQGELSLYARTQIAEIVNPTTVNLTQNNLGLGMGTQRLVNEAAALNPEVLAVSQSWTNKIIKISPDANVKKALSEAIGHNAAFAKQTGGKFQLLGPGCEKLVAGGGLDLSTALNIRDLVADATSSLRANRVATKAELEALFDGSQKRVMNVNDAQAKARRQATACSTGECGKILNAALCPL